MMPVVDDGRLVGVVSRLDILRIFDRPDSEVRTRVATVLASPLWAPEGHHISAEVADGMVHLSGTVRYPSDIQVAVSLIGGVPGVIEVRPELTAEQPEPKPSFLKDTDWR
jgi:CBS domain-containing protein